MKALHMIAFVLAMVGALDWGLVGIGGFLGQNWNVVGMIFSFSLPLLWVVYILVGLSAVWLIVKHKATCRMCSMGGAPMGGGMGM